MLLIDTNILVRCSVGRALVHIERLRERGIELATTVKNVEELHGKLQQKFGLSSELANAKVMRIIEPMEVIGSDEYEHLRSLADGRLGQGGKSDWPALAAALALEAEIWSDDRDFFGVGVPIWSTDNVQFVIGEG